MTLVILSGGIDLAVGAVVGLTSILIARLIGDAGWHPLAAWSAALVIGTLYGAAAGAIVHYFVLPPFLITLAGMFLIRGVAYVVSLAAMPIDHSWYAAAGDFSLDFFPVETLVLLVVWLIAMVIAHFTRFGRNLYAIGGNAQSALLMGLPVARTTIGVYAFSAACATMAGIISTLNAQSGDPQAGTMLELDAIAAVVIGGTLLSGGVGFVEGTLVGVMILGTIQTWIIFQGTLDSSWSRIATGGLLVAFIGLQRLLQARSGVRRHGSNADALDAGGVRSEV
jgi:simple sugar transport system permease protein